MNKINEAIQKELHIWMNEDYQLQATNLFISLDLAERALCEGVNRVDTPQTHCCRTDWLAKGYRIFVHLLDGETIEIKLGSNEKWAKEIRPAHNIERLLLANFFGFAVREHIKENGWKEV